MSKPSCQPKPPDYTRKLAHTIRLNSTTRGRPLRRNFSLPPGINSLEIEIESGRVVALAKHYRDSSAQPRR
jgi:hypothetical protein